MITKLQAMTASEFHQPRDGKPCATWRRNGRTQTWKRSPGRFRVPVKFGLYAYDQITETNAHLVHLASECPNFAHAAAGEPVKLPCGCDDYGTDCQSPALHA